jgi:multiple sugar transport system substrate-binding protein
MLETSTWAGKLAGMPGYTNNIAMIYNPDLLQQAGVPAPQQGWTWDAFTATAQRFVNRTTASGEPLIPLSLAWSSWSTYLGTTGSRIISRDARKITADTPDLLSVMELWLDYLKRGIAFTTPDGKSGLAETYILARNDTVFEVQGPYRLPAFRDAKAREPATVHVPVHPTKRQIHAVNGGHSLIVFKEAPAEQRAAAAAVAKWLNAPHAQAQMCIRNFIPVSKGVAASPELQAYVKTDPAFKGFLDLAPNGWRWPSLPSYDKINKAVNDGIAAILRQEVSPRAGLARAQSEAQVLLDEDVKLMG